MGVVLSLPQSAAAQSRANTIRSVVQDAITQLDLGSPGFGRITFGVVWNLYDRLVTWDRKQISPGFFHYDAGKIAPELAEGWEFSADRQTITFHLRRNARFHDGAPVTARDVKWSLSRAVATTPTAGQMGSGSMTSAEQFIVIDEHTFQVRTPKPDRLTLPNLGTAPASIFNSELAKKHATQADPWALEWMKTNIAAGGAFMVESFRPSEQLVLRRYDDWKSGRLPDAQRVIIQTIPDPSSRVALLERGSADISTDILPRDFIAIEQRGNVKTAVVPMLNAIEFIAFNSQLAPLDSKLLRQAIAYAVPYEEIWKAVYFEKGLPLFGGNSAQPRSNEFPQPFPYALNLGKARELMAKAGITGRVPLSFAYSVNKAAIFEPLGVLLQRSLAEIGIDLDLQKLPETQLVSLMSDRKLQIFGELTTSFLTDPDYWFRIFYNGSHRFNYGNFKSAKLERLLEETRYTVDPALYQRATNEMVALGFDELPILPLRSPSMNVVVAKSLTNYTYWMHGHIDYRPLTLT